jgi:molybdopterin synthase catalytic subunit
LSVFQATIETAAIDPPALHAAFASDSQHAGAIVTFTGQVRGGDVTALAIEHYPRMTERSILDMIDSARQRWSLQAARVVHRVGELAPGEPIVWVGVASAHRAAAFSACEYLMDYLKVAAPLWKRERDRQGVWRWVAAREADDRRAQRWGLDQRAGSSVATLQGGSDKRESR